MSGHACTLYDLRNLPQFKLDIKVQYPGFLYTALLPVCMAMP